MAKAQEACPTLVWSKIVACIRFGKAKQILFNLFSRPSGHGKGMTNQICPLCDSSANFKMVDAPYGKLFTCPTCSDYFIDNSSETYVGELSEVTKTEVRSKLSESAKSSGPNRLFVIRMPRNDELGGDGHGVAKTRMIAEWVSRVE